jgi:formate/nitrite transporter FocA (FNT family)
LQKIIYGVLGGIFIGLGFTAFYMITLKASDAGIGLFLGSIMFAVGIVMCVILGGSLITTNCLTLSCALVKKSEIKKHLIDLGIVTVTN